MNGLGYVVKLDRFHWHEIYSGFLPSEIALGGDLIGSTLLPPTVASWSKASVA